MSFSLDESSDSDSIVPSILAGVVADQNVDHHIDPIVSQIPGSSCLSRRIITGSADNLPFLDD